MNPITIPYHILIPVIICIVGLTIILIKRKKLIQKNKRKLLWISLTVFLLAYLSVVGSALYDDIYVQWNLNSYDLNKDGIFSGNEINEKQSRAMAGLTNDIGRNLSFITGIIFGLPFLILTYVVGLIIMKRKKTTHNTAYKKLLVLCLIKGRCTFATSEFPSEIPRTQTRNFPYTYTLAHIRKKMKDFELKDYDIEDLEDVLIRIESSFGINFVDNELASVTNFGQLSDSIINKIKVQETESCTSQQAFYKLREVIKTEIGIENIEPKTELEQIFPKGQRIKSLKKIEENLGFKLNIIGPTDFIVGFFAILLLGSLIGFFFDWFLPLIGIGISIIGFKIADKAGTELKYETVKQVAEKMRRENYLKSRRHPNTGNKKEIEKTIIDIFATDFNLDKSKLTRETQLM